MIRPDPELLHRLETYYDAAPRPVVTTEEVGGFTLFVKTDPTSWDFYARPRLGLDEPFTAADVQKVLDRQRELGVGRQLEWVHESTPTLLDAAGAAGMSVAECPLLVLGEPTARSSDRVRVLEADSPDLARVVGVVSAGFSGTDEVTTGRLGSRPALVRDGLLAVVAAYDEQGHIVGGGSHSPRGTTTELTGIAVLPRARRRGVGAAITHALVAHAVAHGVETVFLSAQDDAVARVYERVGFVRVGTACVAELPDRPESR